MELIEIISTILLFGSGLLILVVLISFFISRLKKDDASNNLRVVESNSEKHKHRVHRINFAQSKKEKPVHDPQIFQLKQIRPREINLIHKVSFKETGEKTRATKNESEKTNSNVNGSRFKIINEEQKKSGNQAANFF
jgi:hypothetical protein